MNAASIARQAHNAMVDAMDVQRKFSDVDCRLVCNGLHGIMSQRAYAEENGLPLAYYFTTAWDGRSYGPFHSEDEAQEYMGEIGMVDCVPVTTTAPASVITPRAAFYDMVRRAPVGDRADKLRGPQWTDAHGAKHSVMFYRKADCWQAVEHADGEIWLIHEMPCYLPTVCDTPTGALWALRGIVASHMHDVRCTRGH